MQKNRYRTVLPKEETRVRLQNSSNDYINANFVSGPSGSGTQFICTQAPLKETCCDFWQMIWEQNTYVIIMLTRVEERGEEKSVQYWPSKLGERQTFGNHEVKLEAQETNGHFEHRILGLRFGDQIRRVYHLQYLGWPDHGVPNNTLEIGDLIKLTADLQRITHHYSSGPVVVHCSAGVGRTGTFIALYQYFENYNPERPLCVFDIVANLRRQRDSMVQTVEQYYFIFRTIEALSKPEKSIDRLKASTISSENYCCGFQSEHTLHSIDPCPKERHVIKGSFVSMGLISTPC